MKVKGATPNFRSKTGNDKVAYFHCASYELNLYLLKAFKVLQISNMVSTMQILGIIFKTLQSVRETLKYQSAKQQTKKSENKIKPLRETQWMRNITTKICFNFMSQD